MTRYSRHFRRIARQLGSVELMREPFDENAFDLSDLELIESRDEDRRFLDFYGHNGLELAFERYGLRAALKRRGYDTVDFETRADDNRHLLFIHGIHTQSGRRHRIIELAVRRDTLVAAARDTLPPIEPTYDALTIDWLHLCNPERPFTSSRPRLPGQTHPGLGIGERVLEMLYRVAARLELQVVLTTGEYYHNTLLYSRELPLFDPEAAGEMLALHRTLQGHHHLSLSQASWAVEWGHVTKEAEPFRWRGHVQMRPRVASLWAYFESAAYKNHVADEETRHHFALDEPAFREDWERFVERETEEGSREVDERSLLTSDASAGA